MDLDSLRAQAEAFLAESRLEWYLAGAGVKERVELAPIYARHAGLFAREGAEAAARACAGAPEAGGRERLRELWSFLALGLIRERVKELTEQAANFESAATVRLPGGEEVPYRQSAVVQLNEPDRARRTALERARGEVVRRKNAYLAPIHAATHALAGELGFGGYLGMMARLKSYPLGPVREEMARFLRRTEALYLREMGRALRGRLGLDLGEAERHDALHLFRGREHDRLFPAERLAASAREACRGMGLDLEAGGRVRLDLEPRPRKSPRAFCASVRVPEEVYLVIRPRGGHDDYRAFWHELGHALHFAHTGAGAPFEAKRLGDNSVTEGFAMLFDHLLLDGAWLADTLGGEEEDYRGFLGHIALFELYMLRRYAAKIDYEFALHGGPELGGKEALYAGKLAGATQVAYPPESYLDDVDPFFYCANYLRAWMLQAQLREVLKTRFGRRWWRSEGSGAFLKELWKEGQAQDADALSRRLGFGSLGAEPLAEEIEGMLGV
ncbi:MAG: hypothetical protein A3J27_09445 [Candidatus Tectomicrobia bacterium RIFCSPLOWO2_12_FULL_69_37]|nr:MAG: hypothetical protein A3J27_09445 [Candidatus Tectomicrobia bacterium RIFCSPLOWO2_12_FULL_69_37]